jgi:hypothetical protein
MSTEPDHEAHRRVDCVMDADGRITFELPPRAPAGRQLLLRLRPKKGQPETVLHRLDLHTADDGRRRAVLGPRPVLDEGRWDLYLLREEEPRRQRLRAGLRDLRVLVDGQLRDRPSPQAVRIPYVTKDGFLAVRAWLRTAHAEVGDIAVSAGSVTVHARLHGAVLGAEAAVHLRLRGTGTVVRVPEPRATYDGRGFSFAVGLTELTARADTGKGVWDAFVEPSAQEPLIRLARLLDDVADRKEVCVYPPVTVGTAVLHPYYTVDNDFSVKVTETGTT